MVYNIIPIVCIMAQKNIKYKKIKYFFHDYNGMKKYKASATILIFINWVSALYMKTIRSQKQ